MLDQINSKVTPQPPNNQLPTTAQVSHTATWIVVALYFVFPPAAWYFIYKEEKFHRWLPNLLIIFGIIYTLLFTSYLIFVIPKLTNLYNEIGAAAPKNSSIYLSISAGLSLIQLIFGIYLSRKIKVTGKLPKTLLIISILLLALDQFGVGFAVGLIVLSTILPIYNLTATF